MILTPRELVLLAFFSLVCIAGGMVTYYRVSPVCFLDHNGERVIGVRWVG